MCVVTSEANVDVTPTRNLPRILLQAGKWSVEQRLDKAYTFLTDTQTVVPTPSFATFPPSTAPSDKDNSLSRAEAVVITAVVCVVCSFTAGLLLGVLVTLCNVHYHKKQKRDQTERPPVYEDIPLEKKRTDIELQHNEAYGHFLR